MSDILKSFHIGKIGDTVACMHFFSQQYRLHGDKTQYYYKRNEYFTDADYQFIHPLVDIQPYILKSAIVDSMPQIPPLTQISVQKARQQLHKYNFYNSSFQATGQWKRQIGVSEFQDQLRTRLERAYNVVYDKTHPFLTVPDIKFINQPYIIVYCTGRYRCFSDLSCLRHIPIKKIFIGKEQEYKRFGLDFQYIKPKDALHAAILIKGAKLVIGGQSLFWWLAQGLGVNRLLMDSFRWRTCIPQVKSDIMLSVLSPTDLYMCLNNIMQSGLLFNN